MKRKITIELVIEGENADEASSVIDDLLDAGTWQTAFDDRAGDRDHDATITSILVRGDEELEPGPAPEASDHEEDEPRGCCGEFETGSGQHEGCENERDDDAT